MTESTIEESVSRGPETKLHCFGEGPAPAPVVAGWQRLSGFPREARDRFWDLLEPALMEPADPRFQERLAAFCRKHAIAERHAVDAVQACDVLVSHASALDLDRERFCEDLCALSAGQDADAEFLLSRYDAVRRELRGRMVRRTIADHGKVLVGLNWRVDRVVSSDRGAQLNESVIFLSLQYRDGERMDGITLQLTPESLAELKRFAERIGNSRT
jgi:hypothetical protein